MLDLSGYKLTFSDEFNERSISQNGPTVWSDIRSEWRLDAQSDIGFGRSSFVDAGSGYDPFSVSGGALTITAVPDATVYGYPGSWESGLITTQGKFSQTYGYFEMRADLSDAPNAWDAFWLLPNQQFVTGNPGWQEIDIVEHYGTDPNGVYRWIHTTDPTADMNTERQVTTAQPEQASGYHSYGVDWQADKLSFYFDGQFVGERATPSDMHGPMFILADLATIDVPNSGAISTKIDFIRAYSADPHASGIAVPTVSAPDGNDPGFYGASTGSSTGGGSPIIVDANLTVTPLQTSSPLLETPTVVAEQGLIHVGQVAEQNPIDPSAAPNSLSSVETLGPAFGDIIVMSSSPNAETEVFEPVLPAAGEDGFSAEPATIQKSPNAMTIFHHVIDEDRCDVEPPPLMIVASEFHAEFGKRHVAKSDSGSFGHRSTQDPYTEVHADQVPSDFDHVTDHSYAHGFHGAHGAHGWW